MKQFTPQEFVERAKKVHGGIYDYSQIQYIGSKVEVAIGCSLHGPFVQLPNEHLRGRGCPKCGFESAAVKRRSKAASSFVTAALKIHGTRYDYSLVQYAGSQQPVTILCPEHGPFLQKPAAHLDGSGCSKCVSGAAAKANSQRAANTFIQRAMQVHGTKYDYSATYYLDSKSYVTIICPVHGPFRQRPGNHLCGSGCRKCSSARAGKQKTRDAAASFIAAATALHGGRYDYSRTLYVSSRNPVVIVCPTHGAFCQRPPDHLAGGGCPKCGYATAAEKRGRKTPCSSTRKQFDVRSRGVHGDRYDYSKAHYLNLVTPVTIICPQHGAFNQTPASHLAGHGCPMCGRQVRQMRRAKKEEQRFLEGARAVHGDRYDYSRVKYTGARARVTIICPIHGGFEQLPGNHLKGAGCRTCGYSAAAESIKRGAAEDFIQRATKRHGGKYDYPQTQYLRSDEKVRITCLKHGDFVQTPDSHLQGYGCVQCAKEGRSQDRVGGFARQFVARAIALHGDRYDYSESRYIGCAEDISIRCPLHGLFITTPNRFLTGAGCPRCARSQSTRKVTGTAAAFIQAARRVHGNGFDYRNCQYINMHTKVAITCPRHGDFRQTPRNHLNGRRCPDCARSEKESLAEKRVARLLKQNDILFEREWNAGGLRHIGKLRFDFFLPEYGICIEYQGEQHFGPVRFGGCSQEEAELRFANNQVRDAIKRQYVAETADLNLIEIKFDEDIDSTIQRELQKRGITFGTVLPVCP